MPILIVLALLSMSVQAWAEPLIIAHRGASGYLPEHTAEAKAAAHAMGADYIEQDVVLSQDGVAMVLHDIVLEQVSDVANRFPDRARADGKFYVIDFTAAEIQTLTIMERRSRRGDGAAFPKRFPRGQGKFSVSTLAEEIALIQGLNASTGRSAGLYVELKDPAFHHAEGHDLAKIVLEVLAEHGLDGPDEKVFVQCFDWTETQRVRNELGFRGKLVQLIGENDWWDLPDTDFDWLRSAEGLSAIAEVGEGIGPRIQHVLDEQGEPTELVAMAHAAELAVHPYTFRADRLPDFAADFADLIERAERAGVDGLFTDFPDRARDALPAQ